MMTEIREGTVRGKGGVQRETKVTDFPFVKEEGWEKAGGGEGEVVLGGKKTKR